MGCGQSSREAIRGQTSELHSTLSLYRGSPNWTRKDSRSANRLLRFSASKAMLEELDAGPGLLCPLCMTKYFCMGIYTLVATMYRSATMRRAVPMQSPRTNIKGNQTLAGPMMDCGLQDQNTSLDPHSVGLPWSSHAVRAVRPSQHALCPRILARGQRGQLTR